MEKLETSNLDSRWVNLIQRVLLGTPPQEALTSLPPFHMTLINLFFSSHKSSCYRIWAVKTTA